MKKEGIKYKDSGCCPGHDKFPREAYKNRSSLKAKRRTDKLANKRFRTWNKILIREELMGHSGFDCNNVKQNRSISR